jgi:dsDNA-specific endonuclease/ATPase MutS2
MNESTFKVGDLVEFLNEVGGGKVVDVKEDQIDVLSDDDFVFTFKPSELVLKKNWEPSEPEDTVDHQPKSSHRESTDGFRYIEDRQSYMEVDLHIHMVSAESRNLSNHEMVLLQLSHFEKTLAEARRRRLSKVVYIHGIGKGRLRNEIRKRLRDRSNCEFEDGDYTRYGYGATEVRLWYN